jgi:ribulose-bisphosphate carboxylase large chain
MNTRFRVHYRLTCSPKESEDFAKRIACEQSVCLPPRLVDARFLQDEIVGRIEDLKTLEDQTSYVTISYLSETVGSELTQLMNVLYGNISLSKGIQITDIELPSDLKAYFNGPKFGVDGLREQLKIPNDPLIMAQIGPLGRKTHELAELAYRFAKGGVDLIMDEHSLTDQSWSPFRERVNACSAAVQRANAKTGRSCLYIPNITSSSEEMMLRADWAARYGAGGLLVCPGLVGLGSLQRLSKDRRPGLPLITHPAYLGSYVLSPDQGLSAGLLFGTIFRMAGADSILIPLPSERFSLKVEDCEAIVKRCHSVDPIWKTTLPILGGSMSERVLPELWRKFGNDVVYLLGRELYGMSADLVKNVQKLRRVLGKET